MEERKKVMKARNFSTFSNKEKEGSMSEASID
jgi:hypothetical protein